MIEARCRCGVAQRPSGNVDPLDPQAGTNLREMLVKGAERPGERCSRFLLTSRLGFEPLRLWPEPKACVGSRAVTPETVYDKAALRIDRMPVRECEKRIRRRL